MAREGHLDVRGEDPHPGVGAARGIFVRRRTKVVSERLNWRASACICIVVRPLARSTTASGLPEKLTPGWAKTLSRRNGEVHGPTMPCDEDDVPDRR